MCATVGKEINSIRAIACHKCKCRRHHKIALGLKVCVKSFQCAD